MQITLSEVYKAELWPYVKWHSGQTIDENGDPIPEPIPTSFPTISSMDQVTVEFFTNIHDAGAVERLFKSWDAAGRTYKMWSFYADKPENTPQIHADIDMLAAADPQDFSGVGAWSCSTGAEVGGTGTEWYPVPPQYINFMPDIIIDNTDPENPIYGPATDPTDVNLLFGQEPRNFSSFYA